LVRRSYEEPVETFATNVLGVAHLLEAVRQAGRSCVVVVATTDKCYENREDATAYREQDRLGGRDPYSASKACAELVASSYRESFFAGDLGVRLATARAGNVIGGGDWSRDRIVPDAIRALRQRQAVPVRNRTSTRPWQHVLEPLSGYLWLAAALDRPDYVEQADAASLCTAFNFGPTAASNRTVAELVEEVLAYMPGTWVDASEAGAPHEAHKLNLAIDKARDVLGWRPLWGFGETVRETVTWYESVANGKDPLRTTMDQIHHYQSAAHEAGLPWAK
jgi:CDP-glucose 4,6-dehydratase